MFTSNAKAPDKAKEHNAVADVQGKNGAALPAVPALQMGGDITQKKEQPENTKDGTGQINPFAPVQMQRTNSAKPSFPFVPPVQGVKQLKREGAAVPPQPVVQLLRSKDEFEGGVTPDVAQQGLLDLIGLKINNYKLINEDADADFQLRLGAIKVLFSSLHKWFDDHKTSDTDKVPNAIYLKAFYKEVEKEHADLVEKVSATDHLPVNTHGLKEEEISKIKTIWTDLVKGTGNIEIADPGDGFRKRTLANFARLLEGEFGRNMLTDINKDRGGGDNKIKVGNNFTAELGEGERAESEAIPRSSLNKLTENDHKLVGSSENNGTVGLPEYDKKGDEFDAVGFHNFLTGNDNKELIKWKGSASKKGKGTGSLVRLAGEDGYNIGAGDKQILAPEFITLGHELGHAQRLLRGAPLHGEDIADMGVTDPADKTLWNNPEEFVNINAVENSIRGEHGLSARKYHAADQHTIAFARGEAAFEKRVMDFKGTLSPYINALLEFYPQYEVIQNYFTVKPDYGDAVVLQRINRELDAIIADSKLPVLLWQGAGQQAKREARVMNLMSLKMTILAPNINSLLIPGLTTEVIYAMVKDGTKRKNWEFIGKVFEWMRGHDNYKPLDMAMSSGVLNAFLTNGLSKTEYLKADPGLAKVGVLLTASRAADNWVVVKDLMKAGNIKLMFESGLTHEEFETKVDPGLDIDVEIEYRTTDPKAWFFKHIQHVYVRKKMNR